MCFYLFRFFVIDVGIVNVYHVNLHSLTQCPVPYFLIYTGTTDFRSAFRGRQTFNYEMNLFLQFTFNAAFNLISKSKKSAGFKHNIEFAILGISAMLISESQYLSKHFICLGRCFSNCAPQKLEKKHCRFSWQPLCDKH